VNFGIFITPRGKLYHNIIGWKNKIQTTLPDQHYCSHPPHCTILHSEMSNESEIIESLKKLISNLRKFKLYTYKTSVFWNDFATNRSHTLVWTFQESTEIREIQIKIANELGPFIKARPIPTHLNKSKVLLDSFTKFGYPFVGKHWTPHMTVASLSTKKDHYLITEFLSQKVSLDLEINSLELWQIDKEKHSKIYEFSLN